jgi:PIN like domain
VFGTAHFRARTNDTEWLAELAQRGWVVLSKDFSIASNALERLTLFESGARAFLLSQQDLTGQAQVAAFLGALRRVRNIASREPPPFITRVLP